MSEADNPPRRLAVTMTLGPATADDELLDRLAESADRFRLNGSHLDESELAIWLRRLTALFERRGQTTPLIIDLQGAKMRIGVFPTVEELAPRVRLVPGDASDDPTVIPVPHAELFEVVRPGETLVLNDARVALRVRSVTDGAIEADVVSNGPVSSRKGINRSDHPVSLSALLPRDRVQIEVSRHLPFVQYAYSFVVTGSEATILREAAGDRHLVAKIERSEAMDRVAQIDAAFDETWFCRGDLGSQVGLARLGGLQQDYVAAIDSLRGPAMLAGQVLHHMTDHPEPTRSEVVHLHDVARAGWAGVVLSDETAVGRYPGRVAEVLDILGMGAKA